MSQPESQRDAEISQLLDEALRELRQRGAIDTASYEARRPDLADELNGLLETLRAVDTAVEDWRLVPTAAETTHDDPHSHAAATRPVPPVPASIGRYEIREQLGAGGMGTVFRAFDPQLQREVAIKVPKFSGPEAHQAVARQRFLREARAAAPIRHEHVCPIHDVGEHDGLPYVVMAYVAGKSLAERLADGQRFEDVREAVALARQVAEALAVVHGHGLIHRDLKPGNILLDRDGQAVLTDFGLARSRDDSEHLTADGTLLGTPAYMAPEQASPTLGPAGPWTDVYSLGVVVYQMVTGRLPFEGPSLEVIYQIVHEPPPPPSRFRADLDPGLEAAILKAMARPASERYPSGRELADALARWADRVPDAPAAAPTTSLSPGARPPETVVRAGLPDGSAVTVTVRHDGPTPPRQVKVTVAEDEPKARKRRRRLVVSVAILVAGFLLAVTLLQVQRWDREARVQMAQAEMAQALEVQHAQAKLNSAAPAPPQAARSAPTAELGAAADAIKSSGRFAVQQQQAVMVREQVQAERIANRRKMLDEYLYERDQLPTPEDERERTRNPESRRALGDPSLVEIWSGQALNDLLFRLVRSAPRMPPPSVPSGEPLDPNVLKRINVAGAKHGGNVGLLKNGGRLNWPPALSGADLKEERERISSLAADAVKAAGSNKRVDADRLRRMSADIDGLQKQLVRDVAELAPAQYIEAKRFLNQLKDALTILDQPDAASFLNGKYAARGKTVAELVKNMREYGLKFAPAVPGDEAAYVALYRSLAAYAILAEAEGPAPGK
jgi:tRNA A-37 threonylcarbamoyl transferase component Bud32